MADTAGIPTRVAPAPGTRRVIGGVVLSVLAFWLFAQSILYLGPEIGADLGFGPELDAASATVTAAVSGVFLMVAGALADRIGRVRVTYLGLALIVVGSLLIIITPPGLPSVLLIGRTLLGMAGACILPATLALLRANYDEDTRRRALSHWSTAALAGAGLCSLLGGAIAASALGWRAVFLGAILVAVAGAVLLRPGAESRATRMMPGRFDWLGLVSFTVAAALTNVLLVRGPALGWLNPVSWGLIIALALALGVFLRVEWRRADGFVDVRLFADRTFTGATLSFFLLSAAAGPLLVALALMQRAEGLTSTPAAVATAGFVVGIVATVRSGGERLLRRTGPRTPMLLGCLIAALGILLTSATFMLGGAYIALAMAGFTLCGIGLGFYATPSVDAVLANAPRDEAGEAAALYRLASLLGTGFGVVVTATLFTAVRALGEDLGPLSDLFLGRTDSVTIRFASAVGLLFDALLAVLAATAVAALVPPGARVRRRA